MVEENLNAEGGTFLDGNNKLGKTVSTGSKVTSWFNTIPIKTSRPVTFLFVLGNEERFRVPTEEQTRECARHSFENDD